MFCTDVIANRLGMVYFVLQNVRDSVFEQTHCAPFGCDS